MKYLLDTNIVVHFLRGAYNLDEKMRSVGIENCFVSEITILELEYGVENSTPEWQERQRNALDNFIHIFEERILPIHPTFKLYAQNRVRLRKAGTPISDFDLLIGATAVANRLAIVTDNTSELSRIENSRVENWIIRPK
jgi:tRNA(fMet)-specific endonuclease VapC